MICPMARIARVVAVDVAHHVTQRGNARQGILAEDAERQVYRDLLRRAVAQHGLSVLGYCLMSNHVHLVVIPRRAEALAAALKEVHGRYAAYWNAAHASSGHVWQGRFYSCPLDPGHLWEALRYTELHPLRAGMVKAAAAWPWSSAAAHCGVAAADECLDTACWRQHGRERKWRKFLEAGESEAATLALRRCTHTGRPWGSAEFTQALERRLQRRLTPGQGGRPRPPLRRARPKP